MKLLYLSGPYTAPTREGVSANIAAARAVAVKLWGPDYAVLCPHLNTAHFGDDCAAEYDDYISGDLLMVERCDAVVMLPRWGLSAGAQLEREHARRKGIPVFFWDGAAGDFAEGRRP